MTQQQSKKKEINRRWDWGGKIKILVAAACDGGVGKAMRGLKSC